MSTELNLVLLTEEEIFLDRYKEECISKKAQKKKKVSVELDSIDQLKEEAREEAQWTKKW